MQLRDAVLKHSLGRRALHHLDSTYQVEVNDKACAELSRALSDAEYQGPGRGLVEKLAQRGLVGDGPWRGFVERKSSDLVSLELEPIGRCNLDCKHCFVEFSKVRMSDLCFQAILAGATRLGAVELTFNGGEPLLHPHTLEWLEKARARGLRTQLFSNATLIDAEVAARLKAARVARVTVSLDGFEEAHDALRGQGAFRRTTAGLRALVEAKVSVFTTTVVHPGNEPEVAALKRFCTGELGVAGVRVSTIAPLGRAKTAPALQLSPEQFRALYAGELEHASTPRAPGMLSCHAGVNKLYISARGEVHGCHLFEGAAPLGELTRQTLPDIYDEVEETVSGLTLRFFSLERLTRCQGCPALRACRGGCRARAQKLTGDPWGPDLVSCQKRGLMPPLAPAPLPLA